MFEGFYVSDTILGTRDTAQHKVVTGPMWVKPRLCRIISGLKKKIQYITTIGKKNGKAWEILINEDILITMWRSQNTKEKPISILCMYYWSFKYLAINIAKHFVQLWHTYTIISNNGIVKSPYLNSQTILGKTSFFFQNKFFQNDSMWFSVCLNGFSPKNCQAKAIISKLLWFPGEIKGGFHNA